MLLFLAHCLLEVKERGNFSFKSFTVQQETAAMPVTTDACILGAVAEFRAEIGSILDIGTGTGLLALMLAQRYVNAQVTGIDIQEESMRLAEKNFRASPWPQRLLAHHCDLQNFEPVQLFDGIICNPPFFENQLVSAQVGKRISRHTVSISYDALFKYSYRLLAPEGVAWYLLPTLHGQRIVEALNTVGLFPFRRIFVHANATKDAHLMLVACRKTVAVCEDDRLFTYEEGGKLTQRISAILQPFYLHL
jgi:tRNA1Val (adenine37-N6)-methyltransferase